MPCTPTTPTEPSLIEQLAISAHAFAELTPDSDVSTCFAELRDLLWAVIEASPDPAPYTLSWDTVSLFGRSALAEYERMGNPEALDRLKELVSTAMDNLP